MREEEHLECKLQQQQQQQQLKQQQQHQQQQQQQQLNGPNDTCLLLRTSGTSGAPKVGLYRLYV
jgi:long-subunit acyl-CoA synthetase (AMP-forming)